MIRRPPRSTLFPYTRSSDLRASHAVIDGVRLFDHRRGALSFAVGDDGLLRDADNARTIDRKSTRLNSSHLVISYAVFCLKKKKTTAVRSMTTRLFLTSGHAM